MDALPYLAFGFAAMWCGANAVAQAHRLLKHAKIGRWSDWVVLCAGIGSMLAGCYVASQGLA